MDITWPTSHQVSQQSLRDNAQKNVHRRGLAERESIEIGDPGRVGNNGG
jgi:hypothetical protein